MKVLFLTEGPEIPSSRYRNEPLAPYIERAGLG